MTRLRVGLSHLSEHKFHDNIRDSVNHTCDISKGTETTKCHFIHCKIFVHENQALLQSMREIDSNIFTSIKNSLTQIQLYGDMKLTDI